MKPGLENYELQSEIGRDAAGSTWKALRREPETLVRLRLITDDALVDDDVRRRLMADIRIGMTVRHPSLPEILEANEDGRRVFVAMDWHDGVLLGEHLRHTPRLPVAEAVAIATQIARALERAWAEVSLWHGRLTPDCVHLWPEGHVALLDLGQSGIRPLRAAGQTDDCLRLLREQPSYCAPELVRGAVVVDHRADIYALGALLYHMLTGTPPFGDRPPAEALDQHRMGFIEDPCDFDPELPLSAGWVLESMMARDPARRTAGWSEVIEDLNALADGKDIDRPPLPAGASVVRRSSRRDPQLAKALRRPAAAAAARPVVVKRVHWKPHLHRRPRPAAAQRSSGGLARFLAIATFVAGIGAYAFHRYGHKLPDISFPAPTVSIRIDREAAAETRIPEISAMDIPMPPAWNEGEQASATPRRVVMKAPESSKTPQEDKLVGDPRFARGAGLFNDALARFKQFETNKNAVILKDIPAMSEEAARFFEMCRRDFPNDRRLKKHIDESYGLARYARQAMLTAGQDFPTPGNPRR